MAYKNQNPEQIARDKIDQMLLKAGWHIQSKKKIKADLNNKKKFKKKLLENTENFNNLNG